MHNSGGMKEFIPQQYRMDSYEDLKAKVAAAMDNLDWETERPKLWSKIAVLTPQNFQENLWSHLQPLMQQHEAALGD